MGPLGIYFLGVRMGFVGNYGVRPSGYSALAGLLDGANSSMRGGSAPSSSSACRARRGLAGDACAIAGASDARMDGGKSSIGRAIAGDSGFFVFWVLSDT